MLAAPALEGSVASLIAQKRKAKADMQAWELIYEEQNDGLVPTHHDKKASSTYCSLKAKALTIEASMKLCRAEAKAGRAAEDDADRQAAREEGEQRRAARSNASDWVLAADLGHRGEERHDDMQGVGGMENLFEEHVSVSPWQVATMAVATVVPTILFCGLFSFMGFGSLNFAVLKCFVNFYRSTASFAVMILLLLYLFDASQWANQWLQLLRSLLYTVVGLCLILALVMAADDYPYVPLFLFLVLLPALWYKLLKRAQRQDVSMTTSLIALSYALFFLFGFGLLVWLGWVFGGNTWSHSDPHDNLYFWMQNMRCCDPSPPLNWTQTTPPSPPAAAGYDVSGYLSESRACLSSNVDRVSQLLAGGEKSNTFDPSCYVPPGRSERNVCLSVLLLWMTPFVLAMVALFVAIVSLFLGRALQSDQRRRTNLGLAPRVFVFTILIGVVGCWIAASIAGSNTKMSRLVMLGSLLVSVIVGTALERIYGWRDLMRMVVRSNSMMRKMMQFMMLSDWTKALAVWLVAPWFVLVLLLSALNQFMRVHVRRALMVDKERALRLTKRVHERLQRTMSWNWTVVLRRVVLIGLVYLCAQVLVMNFLTFFLSWLVQTLKSMSLVVVTGIFTVIGLIMFLLPPVPGTPVYLGAGLLLTSTAEREWATDEYLEAKEVGVYFWMAAAYAMLVALVIKLFACTLQQKLLGENLRRSVAVRKFVGINSPFMKVMGLLLRERGMSLAKVAILVGGPDWPTSVTVGILGLPLLPILFGTLPVFFLIAPTALYGSFLIVPESAGPAYASLANVLLASSTGLQMLALLSVGRFIEKATFKYAAELEGMEEDQAVVRLEAAELEQAQLYAEITHWRSKEIPRKMRAVLIAAAALMSLTCQVIFFGSSYCFRDFELKLDPSFDEQVRTTLEGKVSNLVEYPGYAVVVCMCIAVALDQVFARWAARYVRQQVALGRKPKHRRPHLALSQPATAAAAAGGAAAVGADEGAGVGGSPFGLRGASKPVKPTSLAPVRSASTMQSEGAARARALAMEEAAVEDRGESFYERADDSEAEGEARMVLSPGP